MKLYSIELVWNREFDFVPYGELFETRAEAQAFARQMEESGDGMRVKKTRIVVTEYGVVSI